LLQNEKTDAPVNITDADRSTIIAWALGRPEVRTVYLYGSRARGDNNADSDIDLAIRLFPGAGDSSTLATWIFWKVEWDETPDLMLSHPVHLEWYEEDQDLEYVGKGVERDGIILFTRD
tara:strand:- start:126 stop:482 length:357 start_codon:yes stop_codon:yes gene_type:complete